MRDESTEKDDFKHEEEVEETTQPYNARARREVSDKDKDSTEQINKGSSEKKFSSLADALKIPVEDKSKSTGEQENASDVLDDDIFADSDDSIDVEDSELFEDYELMADIGVELVDLVVVMGAKAIGGGDESEYTVSQTRRNKLKKPFAQLLKQRQVGVSPEIMVVVMVAVIYSPVVIKAFANRKKKKEQEQKQQDVSKQREVEREVMEAKINAQRSRTVADRPGPSNYTDEKGAVPTSDNAVKQKQRKKRVTFDSAEQRMEMAKKMAKENQSGVGYGKLSDKYGVSVSGVRSMIADAKKTISKEVKK